MDSKKNSYRIRTAFSIVLLCLLFSYDCGLSEKEMDVMYQRGVALFVANKREEALKVFKELYEEDEDYKDVKFVMGKLLYYNRKFKEAEELFQELSDEDPNNYNALGWLIKTQFAETPLKKDLAENLERFLSKDSENLEVLFISARILEETGKPDQAIIAYQKILSQTRMLAFAHRQLEYIYRKANLEKKAAFHNQKYLELTGKSDSQKE
ncbi:tetratricopeptide repeat protein [Leptospira yasudae]|uniref:Tetratricopeptide repeat protein n=1 Tax=Leptospira yasudae TaxID=2202201 RepID=A0A6N4QUY2_9LEPT|nr:tetratricopeptide repeat protein [Leptospira yasudae]TGL79170.1 tetratricopeptide repeat protein [Leptospira yasudae]TGL83082.1 tetratricopeptide repeat protein [Leptospira yasudae]TGL85687.1 tetratricopeptide repeat protein [Leptospira yasudae]